jgi:hypothetical protein
VPAAVEMTARFAVDLRLLSSFGAVGGSYGGEEGVAHVALASPDDLTTRATTFEATPLIKQPLFRGVSDQSDRLADPF